MRPPTASDRNAPPQFKIQIKHRSAQEVYPLSIFVFPDQPPMPLGTFILAQACVHMRAQWPATRTRMPPNAKTKRTTHARTHARAQWGFPDARVWVWICIAAMFGFIALFVLQTSLALAWLPGACVFVCVYLCVCMSENCAQTTAPVSTSSSASPAPQKSDERPFKIGTKRHSKLA